MISFHRAEINVHQQVSSRLFLITSGIEDLTSIFVRSSNQSDEPPLCLRANLLSKLHQDQRLNPL